MKRLLSFSILTLSIIAIGGCAQGSADSDNSVSEGGTSRASVLSKLRPKANPNIVRAVEAEEHRRQEEQIARAQEAAQAQQKDQGNLFNRTFSSFGSMLPKVSTEPISAPPAESIASATPTLNPFEGSGTVGEAQGSPAINPANLTPAEDLSTPVTETPGGMDTNQVATYSLHYSPAGMAATPPGAMGIPGAGAPMGGVVPPPPAVTLSTDARVGYPPPPPNAMPYNPYGYYQPPPGYNPYAQPYPSYPPQQQQPPEPEKPKRPAGLFGSGGGESSGDEDSAPAKRQKKEEDHSDFVPIRPTGMHPRSPYKQRDDLKILWDGALGSYAFHDVLAEDDKLESILRRSSVGMPPDSTRGMFSVPTRRVVTIFRPIKLNKKVSDRVRKLQADLVQCYYRYLHTYNKYVLAQQTVAARKQEIEVARSRAEKQRAAADLSASQNEADSAREDMKAAQYELAAIAGARSARSVISRVSGVTPSVGALAQAEKSVQPVEIEPEGSDKGVFGSVGSFFFGNRGGSEKKEPPKKVVKKSKPEKAKQGFSLFGRKGDDLAPSPSRKKSATKVASKSAVPAVSSSRKPTKKAASPISFELKNVNITARKSILSVAIKNSGSKDFKVSSDRVSIAEGSRKISKETLRAKFDSTLVRPNQEVNGKITIYGRPWNDRLAVYISDGSKKFPLKRR